MSNVVDDRVVKMKFDNEEFDSNIKDSMRSLDDLDKSLKNMDKGSYGGNLSSALSGIGGAVDDLANRFDAWGIVGMEVIRKVTDFAIDKGAEIVKALSIDNITAGWESYEQLSSNIYSLMAQTGMTYAEAEPYMNRISKYADYTSFSMTQMTSAFQQFMAQGLNAEEAEAMVYGIGNSITYAGKSAKEGSEAFSYFSKALALGNMDRRTWQSLLMQNIATSELQQQYLDAAVAVGSLRKEVDGTYTVIKTGLNFDAEAGGFIETLNAQEGKWMDKEAMLEVYANVYGGWTYDMLQYADAQEKENGTMYTYNELVEEYTGEVEKLGYVIDEFGKKVLDSATVAKILSEAIDAVKDQAGTAWRGIFTALFGNVEYAQNVWGELSDYLTGVFVGPIQRIGQILGTWGELTHELGGRDSFIQIFRNMARAASALVNPIKEAYKVIFNPPSDINVLAQKFGDIVKRIEDFTESLILNEDVSSKFQRVWEVIFEVLKTVTEGIRKIWGLLTAFGSIVKPIIGFLGELVVGISEIIDVIFKVFNLDGNLWTWLSKPTNALKKIGASMADTLSIFNLAKGPVVEGVTNAFDKVGVAADHVGRGLDETRTSLGKLWEEFKNSESFKAFKENGETALGILGQLNGAFINEFKKAYSKEGGGIVGVAKGAYEGIKTVVGALYDALGIMLNDHFGTQLTKIKEFAGTVESKVAELVNKIKNLGSQAMAAITGSIFGESIFGDVTKTQEESSLALDTLARMRQNIDKEMKAVQSSGKAMSIVTNGISAVGIGGAFLRINQILKNVSEMIKSMKGMWDSIGGTFNSLTNALKTMQLEVKADIIKDIALALVVLAASLVAISLIPTEKLGPAIAAISTLIVEMGALMYAISKMDFGNSMISAKNNGVLGKTFEKTSSNMTKAAMTILEMSAAILILSAAMKSIAEIKDEDFGKALGGISALLIELTVFAKVTDGTVGGLSGNVGMNVFKMASGLIVMAEAMKLLAELDDDKNSLGKGLGAVGGILTMLFTFSAAMGKWGGGKDIGDMSSLIGLAAGLAALALVIKTFANIPTDQLIKGGLAVAGALTAVGLFMAVMSSLGMTEKQILSISSAIVIFSAGLLVMAGALTVFNLVQWDSVLQAGAALGIFIAAVALVDTLHLDITLMSFGAAVALFGVGIGAFGAGLLAAATALTLISVELPLFVAELVETGRAFLAGIVSLKPEIVAAVISLIEALCEAIVGTIETILTTLDVVALAIFEHFLSTLSQLIDIFEKYWPKIREALLKFGNALMGKLKEWAPKVWNWLKETLYNLGKTIYEHFPEWLANLGQFLLDCLAALGNYAIDLLGWLGDFLINILKTITSKALEFKDAAVDYMVNFWDGLGSKFEEILTGIREFIQTIITGILGFLVDIWNAGVSLIDSFLGGIFSKDKDVYDAGAGTATQYNQGVDSKGYESKRAGENLAGNVEEGAGSVDLYSVGVDAVEGFLKGLAEKRANARLVEQAKHLGDTTYKTLKNTLEIKSPSKKMEYLAKMALQGYNKGLLSKTEYNDIILSCLGLGGGTVQYTIEGLKSKWPELFAEIDTAGDEAAEHGAEAGKKISDTITDNIDPNPTITVVLDTTEFDKKLEKLNKDLDDLKKRREDELLLGDAADADKISDIDEKIDELEKERKETNNEYMSSMGLGTGNYNYELRDSVLDPKKRMEMLGLGNGTINYELRDKYVGKDDEKNAIDRVFNNITVNQNINSTNPTTPTDQYRAGQYAAHAIVANTVQNKALDAAERNRLQPYYDPVTGKYLN